MHIYNKWFVLSASNKIIHFAVFLQLLYYLCVVTVMHTAAAVAFMCNLNENELDVGVYEFYFGSV